MTFNDLLHTFQSDPERRARFERTAAILSRSGLMDVTMRTADLLRKNQQLGRDLAALKRETQTFVNSVLANPENAHLVGKMPAPIAPVAAAASSQQLFVSDSLDFHVMGRNGKLEQLRTSVKAAASAIADVESSESSCEQLSQVTSSSVGSHHRLPAGIKRKAAAVAAAAAGGSSRGGASAAGGGGGTDIASEPMAFEEATEYSEKRRKML